MIIFERFSICSFEKVEAAKKEEAETWGGFQRPWTMETGRRSRSDNSRATGMRKTLTFEDDARKDKLAKA